MQDEDLVADGFGRESGLEFLADVAVDQFGVCFELVEGVLAEGGEEVPVEGLPVAVEGGELEPASGQVLFLPAGGELAEGELFGFLVGVAVSVRRAAAGVRSRQPLGDRAIGASLGHKPEHFALAVGDARAGLRTGA